MRETIVCYKWRKRCSIITTNTNAFHKAIPLQDLHGLHCIGNLCSIHPGRIMQKKQIKLIPPKQLKAFLCRLENSRRTEIIADAIWIISLQFSSLCADKRLRPFPFPEGLCKNTLCISIGGCRIKMGDALLKGIENGFDRFILINLAPKTRQSCSSQYQPIPVIIQ